MRRALSGLTTRGRSFLAAGLAATACSVLLGQRDLLHVGVLLGALPLLSAAVLAGTRHRVTAARTLLPARVEAGHEARVRLLVTNVSRWRCGPLMLEDHVPYVLGQRPRFVLGPVEAGGRREVTYRVRSDVRGVFAVGPLRLRLADPFGMCELTRAFPAHDTLVVTPAVRRLPAVALGGDREGLGDWAARNPAVTGEEDVVPREYRHGDDVRRVHWRSTARRGELMVRREERSGDGGAVVLLDTREAAHRGSGPSSSFEWAVSAAASVAVHLTRRGRATALVTPHGDVVAGAGAGGPAAGERPLLDALARIAARPADGRDAAGAAARACAGSPLVVAVLAGLTAEDVRALAAVAAGRGRRVAIVLDTAAWDPLPRAGTLSPAAAARALTRGGWRVLPATASARLPELWRGAAASGPAPGPGAGSGSGPARGTGAGA